MSRELAGQSAGVWSPVSSSVGNDRRVIERWAAERAILGATTEHWAITRWDPSTKQVKQWTMNSFGSFGELTQVAFDPNGEDVWEGTVVTPDGKKHPAREVYTVSGETVTGKHYLDGELVFIVKFHQKEK